MLKKKKNTCGWTHSQAEICSATNYGWENRREERKEK